MIGVSFLIVLLIKTMLVKSLANVDEGSVQITIVSNKEDLGSCDYSGIRTFAFLIKKLTYVLNLKSYITETILSFTAYIIQQCSNSPLGWVNRCAIMHRSRRPPLIA